MKNLTLAIGAALLWAMPAVADPIFGRWKTIPDDNGNYGHIEVKNCGGTICGTLAKSFDGAGKQIASEHTGKKIVWDMKPNGGGKYSGGKIWSPDRDKVYTSKLNLLDNNSLNVSGCIAFICRDGGTWTRVK